MFTTDDQKHKHSGFSRNNKFSFPTALFEDRKLPVKESVYFDNNVIMIDKSPTKILSMKKLIYSL